MKASVIYVGAFLESIYLVYIIALGMPTLSPLFIELAQHIGFQIVALTIILVGAFSKSK